jgi:DNA-directed RNA polymerase specialized sigma24 family protein
MPYPCKKHTTSVNRGAIRQAVDESNLTPDQHAMSIDSDWQKLILLIRSELSRGDLPSEAVDDLTQHVLLELVGLRRPPRGLRGLAVRIARWRLVDWLRRAILEACCKPLADELNGPIARPVNRDLAIDLTVAMDRMLPATRAVFYSRGIEGRTRDETVELLGLSLHEVRVHYEQAIRIVAEVLELDDSGEEPSPRAKKVASNASIS